MAVSTIQVYKNEDINNPEYATTEEVQRAFFGKGVFIKHTDGGYDQVITFDPARGVIKTRFASYSFIQPK